MNESSFSGRRPVSIFGVAAVVATVASFTIAIPSAQAATGCRVDDPVPAAFTPGGNTCTGGVGSPGPAEQSAAYPNPERVAGDTGTHDPAVVKTPSGGYLEANTGFGIALKTSADRITWRNAGSAFPNGTPWANPYTGGSPQLWAPDISYRNSQYYMYYAASTAGSRHSAIFLATSTTGAAGSWTNRGLVIETATGSSYNAIDPNLVVDGAGKWWLDFGSFSSGIKMIPLNPATGMRSGADLLSISSRLPAHANEAPFIYRHGGYYYLFVSFDYCCRGAASTYRIMVGRSTSVTGPYTDRNGTAMMSGGGTQILASHGSIHGPGHEAVLNDNGTDVLFYHYYADNSASFLGVNQLGWDTAGWPYVR